MPHFSFTGESVYIVDKCPKLTEDEILSRRCSEPVKSKESKAKSIINQN